MFKLLIWRGFWGVNLPLSKVLSHHRSPQAKSLSNLKTSRWENFPQSWNPVGKGTGRWRVQYLPHPQLLMKQALTPHAIVQVGRHCKVWLLTI